jgi:hypothetical protein
VESKFYCNICALSPAERARHKELTDEGALLCLRLTGEEGIKPFIRAELPMGAK